MKVAITLSPKKMKIVVQTNTLYFDTYTLIPPPSVHDN